MKLWMEAKNKSSVEVCLAWSASLASYQYVFYKQSQALWVQRRELGSNLKICWLTRTGLYLSGSGESHNTTFNGPWNIKTAAMVKSDENLFGQVNLPQNKFCSWALPLLCMHKVSRHQLFLQINPECRYDWLDMFPSSAVIKLMIGLWGKGWDICHQSIISSVFYSKCLSWFVSSFVTSLAVFSIF